jgi:hypothetical protein
MRTRYRTDVLARQWPVIVVSILVTFAATSCSGQSTRPMPHTVALVQPADLARVGRNSPAGVALQLWRAVQVGDAASAAGFYDQRVLHAIGFTRVGGALAQQRQQLEVLRPKILSTNRTGLGVEVIVQGKNMVRGTRESDSQLFSFLFRRGLGGWRIGYDTLLGDALPPFVYSQVQAQVAPGSNKPSPQAQAAAQRISDLYRGLFSSAAESPVIKPKVTTAPKR